MKFASLVIALSGSMLIAEAASAQEAAYASPDPQPVYAGPAPSSGAPGTIKDTSAHDRPLQLSALAYIPWVYGIGIGAKLGAEIPVAKDGFISSINDSVAVEPVFFFAYSSYYTVDDASMLRFAPGASFVWNFHLKPQLTVYGAGTLAVEIQRYSWDNRYYGRYADDDVDVRVLFELAGGVKWNFAEKVALRAELGWYGPRAGIAFSL